MKNLLYTIVFSIAICLAIPSVAIAQNSQDGRKKTEEVKKDMEKMKDALKAQQESIKLQQDDLRAEIDADHKKSKMFIRLIIFIFLCSSGATLFFKYKSTILNVINAFTGGFRTKGDINSLESKKILTGAMYALQQGAYLNTLKTDIGDRLYTILKDWWDINDRDSALETLDYLRDKGYAFYFPTVLKAFSATSDQERKDIILAEMTAQEDAEKAYTQTYNLLESIEVLKNIKTIEKTEDVEKYGVTGWDAGRLIFIARCCYDAKYIEEEEAWAYIDVAYSQAQRAFKSWDELEKSYVLGRFVWRGKDADDGMQLLGNDLIEKPKSPWKQVAWKS